MHKKGNAINIQHIARFANPYFEGRPKGGTSGAGDLQGAIGSRGASNDDDDDQPALPSSWLPITGPGRGRGAGGADGAGDPTGRVRGLLDRLAVRRAHLVALMLLAPVAATILIAIVSRIVDGG